MSDEQERDLRAKVIAMKNEGRYIRGQEVMSALFGSVLALILFLNHAVIPDAGMIRGLAYASGLCFVVAGAYHTVISVLVEPPLRARQAELNRLLGHAEDS